MLSTWLGRPSEIRALLNPYFCSVLLFSSIDSYNSEGDKKFPIELLFLVLPLVLHKKTRSILPKKKSASLGLWAKDNELNILSFYLKAKGLNKYTLLALSNLIDQGYISIDSGKIEIQKKIKGISAYSKVSEEIEEIYKKSCLVGRWFFYSGKPSSIYTYLGVQP